MICNLRTSSFWTTRIDRFQHWIVDDFINLLTIRKSVLFGCNSVDRWRHSLSWTVFCGLPDLPEAIVRCAKLDVLKNLLDVGAEQFLAANFVSYHMDQVTYINHCYWLIVVAVVMSKKRKIHRTSQWQQRQCCCGISTRTTAEANWHSGRDVRFWREKKYQIRLNFHSVSCPTRFSTKITNKCSTNIVKGIRSD